MDSKDVVIAGIATWFLFTASGAQASATVAALDAISLSELITARSTERSDSGDATGIAAAFVSGNLDRFPALTSPRELLDRLALAPLLQPDGFQQPTWRPPGFTSDREKPADDERSDTVVIAIDPGHGGSDPGAEGPNGLLEKHLTLDIARRVQSLLASMDGVDIVLTRQSDAGLSRSERVAAVRGSGADLFFSLHFNHLPQSAVTLVESFYAGPANIAESRARQQDHHLSRGHILRAATQGPSDISFTQGSERFARLAQRHIYGEVSRDNPAAENAGVKQDTLFILTRSYTAGALIELTCLSNADEAARLEDEDYRERLAAGLADAVRAYVAQLETRPLDGTDA